MALWSLPKWSLWEHKMPTTIIIYNGGIRYDNKFSYPIKWSKVNCIARKKPGERGIFNLYALLLTEFLKVLDYFVIKLF